MTTRLQMHLIKALLTFPLLKWVSGTITGLSYMDPLISKSQSPRPEDPCNPLYWYPKNIPEYCYLRKTPKVDQNPVPIPLPIPIPSQPLPIPIPISQSLPAPACSASMPPIQMPVFPQTVPLPFGIPITPMNPMLPVAGVPAMSFMNSFPQYRPPYQAGMVPGIPGLAPMNPMLPVSGLPAMSFGNSFQQYRPPYQAGMVPGIPGLVTDDGGINILPFSDAYADLLEKHRHKMIKKKFKKLFDDYKDYPGRRQKRKRKHWN